MQSNLIEEGVALILKGLEVDPNDHNFTETPKRYAKAMGELFAQHSGQPTSFAESYTDFILVRGHEIYTLCPHHLLPVRMCVSLAYIPSGRVLGLSKLVRAMQSANNGPVMQERFTYAVRHNLASALVPRNGPPLTSAAGNRRAKEWEELSICVLVEGWHGCMSMRGVKSSASTITMASSGRFISEPALMERFMLLARGR